MPSLPSPPAKMSFPYNNGTLSQQQALVEPFPFPKQSLLEVLERALAIVDLDGCNALGNGSHSTPQKNFSSKRGQQSRGHGSSPPSQ
jgi:hypothetical protein